MQEPSQREVWDATTAKSLNSIEGALVFPPTALEDLDSMRVTGMDHDSALSSSSSDSDNNASQRAATPLTSTPPPECNFVEPPPQGLLDSTHTTDKLHELFAENITAKILRTAQAALPALPDAFPEIVVQGEDATGRFTLRPAEFWTCGFFPGMLYTLLERVVRYPGSVQISDSVDLRHMHNQLLDLCHAWSHPIRSMDSRTDTHDIGFIIMPALRVDWELHGNRESLDSIVRAARSLASRYLPSAKAIRSWDLLRKKDIKILDQEDNMIVIIDSLCNLDLLYYAAQHAQDPSLSQIATAHAETLLRSHLRPEPTRSPSWNSYKGQWYSTCHVANLEPKTGDLKYRLTAQGYHRDSTWSRGQAWGILGYAETYMWTKDARFLEVACGLTEYFLARLEDAPACVLRGRNVPLWDFDAPIENEAEPLRDSSAGVIAANGILILSQALAAVGQAHLASRYLSAALAIVQDTLDFALAEEKARLIVAERQCIAAEDVIKGLRFDGILKFGTANNNADAVKRYANHGLVYADYYLALFGNRLLQMGLC